MGGVSIIVTASTVSFLFNSNFKENRYVDLQLEV
jgi:hypothetical protein